MYVLKLRVKYTKTGALRFIGHLDVMRFFQKAIRRAKLDIAYTKGFSPHQIISFAAPMPLGMTSEGEYFDAEFVSVTTAEDMKMRLNAVMPPEIQVISIVKLPDDAKPSMALVTATDYIVTVPFAVSDAIKELLQKPEICVTKKTKSSEATVDIKPMIFELALYDPSVHGSNVVGVTEAVYMKLASGSSRNLKPELVIGALADTAGITLEPYSCRIHRLETYLGEEDALRPMYETGEDF